MIMILDLTALLGFGASYASALTYETSLGAASINDFKSLVMVDRFYAPYGPDLTTTPVQSSDEIWSGFGFGLGGMEHFAYDHIEKYIYGQSELGYLSIIDYSSFPARATPYSLDLTEFQSDVKDVAVCPEQGLVFVSLNEMDKVNMYSTVKRGSPSKPVLLSAIDAGHLPDILKLSPDCSVLAVANENEGDALNQGGVTLVSNFKGPDGPSTTTIAFNGFTDAYLLNRNVHMPLTEKAMQYWDDFSNIADNIDWASIRAVYNPALFLEPENFAFSDDGKVLYVNLQENSALLRIDIETASAKAVDGYGLKAWTSGNGIDIVEDDGCSLFVTNPALYSNRAPDGIATVDIDGVTYILTADEGDDKSYGNYDEKADAGDVFNGGTLDQAGFTAPSEFFNPDSTSEGFSAPFNSDCENTAAEWCAAGLEISLGSSAVDYETNPEAPVMTKVVAFGGRGISIFKAPASYEEKIEFVWDSGSDFEKEGCDAYPYAHNSIQDEKFSPVGGAYWILEPDDREDLIEMNDPNFDGCTDAGDGNPGACPLGKLVDERALSDGLAPESVIVAVACDRLLAIGCGESNSACFIYDISDIQNPVFKQSFHLSPASATKSPGVAYADRTLGEIDPESILFLSAEQSPTGKAAIIFAGALSSTLSFWEFECAQPVPALTPTVGAPASSITAASDDGGLSTGAIVGIAVGVIAGIALVVLAALKLSNKSSGKEPDTTYNSGAESVMVN